MTLNPLVGAVDKIDSSTLPEAAALANGIVTAACKMLDTTMTNAEACIGDAITDIDGMLDRKLTVLEQILLPVNQIVSGGLKLSGTIGGIPVELVLSVPAATQPSLFTGQHTVNGQQS